MLNSSDELVYHTQHDHVRRGLSFVHSSSISRVHLRHLESTRVRARNGLNSNTGAWNPADIRQHTHAALVRAAQSAMSSGVGVPPGICLLLLGGLPGAGKSTFVQHLKALGKTANCDKATPTVFYISFDNMYENLVGSVSGGDEQISFCADKWRESRGVAAELVKHLVRHLAKNDGMGTTKDLLGVSADCFSLPVQFASLSAVTPYIILLDDNFYYKSMRHVFFKVAKEFRLYFCQMFLSQPFDVCSIRNSKRPIEARVPQPVMERMAQVFEWPDASSKETYSIVSEDTDLSATVQSLMEGMGRICLQGPVPEKMELSAEELEQKELDRLRTVQNEVHIVDNFTRKRIGVAMAQASKHDLAHLVQDAFQRRVALKELTRRLQVAKKGVLDDVRMSAHVQREDNAKLAAGVIDNVYAGWKGAYLNALNFRGQLEETVEKLDIDSLLDKLDEIKHLSLTNESFRSEAATSGLLEYLARCVRDRFAKPFIAASTFASGFPEIDGLRILKSSFICFRNFCAGAAVSQETANTSGAIGVCIELMTVIMRERDRDLESDAGEEWRSTAIGCIRCGVQFVGNSVVDCAGNQDFVWRRCVESSLLSEFVSFGARMDQKVLSGVCMIVYNCIRNADIGPCDDLLRLQQLASEHGVLLSMMLQHVVTDAGDKTPGFVWMELLCEKLIETNLFGVALDGLKPAASSPVPLSMAQRVLCAFVNRLCRIDDEEDNTEGNVSMLKKLSATDAIRLIEILTLLVDDSKPERRESEELTQKHLAWRAFVLDAINSMLTLCSELALHGSPSTQQAIADDLRLLEFIIVCLAEPTRIGISSSDGDNKQGNDAEDIPTILLLKVLANIFAISLQARDAIREMGAISVILNLTRIDKRRPLMREWGLMAIRNMCANNEKNQAYIASLQPKEVVQTEEMVRKGVTATLVGGQVSLTTSQGDYKVN